MGGSGGRTARSEGRERGKRKECYAALWFRDGPEDARTVMGGRGLDPRLSLAGVWIWHRSGCSGVVVAGCAEVEPD